MAEYIGLYLIIAFSFALMWTYRYARVAVLSVLEYAQEYELDSTDLVNGRPYYYGVWIVVGTVLFPFLFIAMFKNRHEILVAISRGILKEYYK